GPVRDVGGFLPACSFGQESPTCEGMLEATPQAVAVSTPPSHDVALDRYLSPTHGRTGGNACALLPDGAQAYPAMLKAILSAKRVIRLETYMFLDDAVGREFRDALLAAVQRGVEVSVLYDWVGSIGTPRAFFRTLREAGARVRAFRPF